MAKKHRHVPAALSLVLPAYDPRTAAKLEEVDQLRLQNANLRLEAVTRERDAIGQTIFAKYATEGEHLHVEPDGSLKRSPGTP